MIITVQKWIEQRGYTIVEKIQDGWSSDEKYVILTRSKEKLLLRISSVDRLEERKTQFEYMKQFSQTAKRCQDPVEFSIIPNGDYIFTLLTYVEGVPLEQVISTLSNEEQYRLGIEAGERLRAFHEIPHAINREEAIQRLIQKKLMQLAKYEQSIYRIDGDEKFIKYVKEHMYLIEKQSIVLQHGDFHIGNFIYTPQKSLGIIDFDRSDVGDSYEEFLKLAFFSREVSIPFSIGQITSYFNGKIPKAFWEILKVYVFHTSMYSMVWAANFSQVEVDGMMVRYNRVLEDYDNGQLLIPNWWKDGAVK